MLLEHYILLYLPGSDTRYGILIRQFHYLQDTSIILNPIFEKILKKKEKEKWTTWYMLTNGLRIIISARNSKQVNLKCVHIYFCHMQVLIISKTCHACCILTPISEFRTVSPVQTLSLDMSNTWICSHTQQADTCICISSIDSEVITSLFSNAFFAFKIWQLVSNWRKVRICFLKIVADD